MVPEKPCTQLLQQVKLISAFYERLHNNSSETTSEEARVISVEFFLHLQSSITKSLHMWMQKQSMFMFHIMFTISPASKN